MPFFAVDDGFYSHPKRIACSTAAVGVWALAGSWSSHHRTDGLVPRHALATFGGKPKDAQQLVSAGLWEEVEGGWLIHDFHDYNPTAEEVREKQVASHEAKVRAGRAGGIASGITRRRLAGTKQTGSSNEAEGQAEDEQNEAPSPPLPSPKSPSDSPVASLPDRFDEFWQTYPRRIGKGQAVKAWRAALKKTDPDTLITAAETFARSMSGKDPQYVPHAATWLNGERWLDERTPLRAVPKYASGFEWLENM